MLRILSGLTIKSAECFHQFSRVGKPWWPSFQPAPLTGRPHHINRLREKRTACTTESVCYFLFVLVAERGCTSISIVSAVSIKTIIILRHGSLVPLLARFGRFDSAKSNLWSNESNPKGSMHRIDPNGHSGCTYIFPDLYRTDTFFFPFKQQNRAVRATFCFSIMQK